jgi:Mg-chelatase subunit ChlD
VVNSRFLEGPFPGTAKLPLLPASILLLARGFSAVAQSGPDPSTHSLLVSVIDSHGNAIPDLTKDNFRVKVSGQSATVAEASYGRAARRIVVLLDMSGSMAGESERNKKWPIARDAVEDLLTETPANVQIALITFSSEVHDIFDFSQDRASIMAWLKRGPSQRSDVKGRRALYDAAVAATTLFQSPRAGDAIYAVTDGGDNSSNVSPTDTRTRLLRAGIRFFLFLFAEPHPPVREELESVLKLTHETGGFVFGVTGERRLDSFEFNYDDGTATRDRIKQYTRALNIQVDGFYTVQLDTPSLTKTLNKVSLEIVDGNKKRRKDAAWTYQRILPGPSGLSK